MKIRISAGLSVVVFVLCGMFLGMLVGCGGGGGGSSPGGPTVNAPSITSQPSNVIATVGSSASFFVTASSTGLSFQWFKVNPATSKGVAIEGATSDTFTISSVSATDAGSFFVVVSNSAGSVTSSVATLTFGPSGNAAVTVASPLIPAATASIVVSFLSGSTVVSTRTVSPPVKGGSVVVNFSGLPVGTFTLSAQALPFSDGTGIALASVGKTVSIAAGKTTAVTVNMKSTIVSFQISPNSPTLQVGQTLALTANAIDASGSVVTTSPSTISWTSSDPSVATITAGGVATGVAAGPTTLTVTDSESGVSASITLTVAPATGGGNVSVH